MLNASQKRTKRAPFTDALMSSVPAGKPWYATTRPDGRQAGRSRR
jgi:hypothetical protein